MKDFFKKFSKPQTEVEDLDSGYDSEYYAGSYDKADRRAEDRRHHQIGVGVGAGHPVFDAPGGPGPGGNAQRHRAVVEAPGGGHGDVEARLEAAEGVEVGGADRHGGGHSGGSAVYGSA